MHTVTHLGIYAATLGVLSAPAAAFHIGTATADTRVVMTSDLRRCDFSLVSTAAMVRQPRLGTGSAVIRTSGLKAIAEVHLADSPDPGTHFDVGMIQEPRPSSATCGPGDPGTAFSGMDTDAAGNATVTIQDTIRPNTTGVWVIIERSNANSQNPAEFYTSEFVAPV